MMSPSSSPPIGIVAEDKTDCDALAVLVRKISKASSPIGIERRFGNGCSRLQRKLRPWLGDLNRRGCAVVVVVHDLDRHPQTGQLNDEQELRSRLEAVQAPTGMLRYICIPKEELEAWFWSDIEVLRRVARDGSYRKECHHPEALPRPKEALMKLSRDSGGRARYSTNQNAELAEMLNMDLCARKCPAFEELKIFLEKYFGAH